MMRLRRWWQGLNFSRKIFLFTALLVTASVPLAEILFELLAEVFFAAGGRARIDWQELPAYGAAALLQGLLCAFLIRRMIMRRLDRLAAAADRIAGGDLTARLPETGDPRDAFTRVACRFNMMAATVERLLMNEKRLLSDISHELRSPLARIHAAAELMGLKNTDGAHAEYLRRIEAESARMNRMIGLLLKQGKDSLSVRGRRERTDVSSAAADLADGFRMQGQTQRKIVAAAIAPALFVIGYPDQLLLIMENLLGNALFYAPEDSTVEFTAETAGDRIRIAVRDYGPGVPEEQLEDIFRAFYRVDSSRDRRSGGAGLGLALVKEAVTALGGTVWAENAGPGLRVTVLLPRAGEDGMPWRNGFSEEK